LCPCANLAEILSLALVSAFINHKQKLRTKPVKSQLPFSRLVGTRFSPESHALSSQVFFMHRAQRCSQTSGCTVPVIQLQCCIVVQLVQWQDVNVSQVRSSMYGSVKPAVLVTLSSSTVFVCIEYLGLGHKKPSQSGRCVSTPLGYVFETHWALLLRLRDHQHP
jgi:hypothetical protein